MPHAVPHSCSLAPKYIVWPHLAGKHQPRQGHEARPAQVAVSRLKWGQRGLCVAQGHAQRVQHSIHSARVHQLLRCAAAVPARQGQHTMAA